MIVTTTISDRAGYSSAPLYGYYEEANETTFMIRVLKHS